MVLLRSAYQFWGIGEIWMFRFLVSDCEYAKIKNVIILSTIFSIYAPYIFNNYLPLSK